MKARAIRRPDLHPLPVAGWKSIGVLPTSPDPVRPPAEHEAGEVEHRDWKFRYRCICGWTGAFFTTQYEAERSLFAHCEREAKRRG